MDLFKQKTFLMDENVKMSTTDIEKLGACTIINSTDKFPKGTPDEVLTKAAKKNGWIVVSKDIRMALRSLIDGVDVIYISDDFQTISYLQVHINGRRKYHKMFDYLEKRFGFD